MAALLLGPTISADSRRAAIAGDSLGGWTQADLHLAYLCSGVVLGVTFTVLVMRVAEAKRECVPIAVPSAAPGTGLG